MFVYIQEAHPEDGWQVDSNINDNVIFREPKTWEERRQIAATACTRLNLDMPVVVDTIDNQIDGLYAGWPERLFVVDREGRLAYVGKQGPWGFKPDEVERTLRELLRKR